MSFAAKPDTNVPSATTDPKHSSSYKEGEPVGLGWGRDVWPSNWISDRYDEHTAYGGQNKPEWQYASIAARYCKGPVDFVGKVYQDGKEIANWDYQFADGEESHEFTLNASLQSGRAFKAIVHRGTDDAPESGVANLRAKTGQHHPPYRGYCWIEWINMDLGQGSNSIPSYAVEIGTNAPALGAFPGGPITHPHGVNLIAAAYALLTDEQGGNLDPSLIDEADIGDQCLALETIGVSGRTGSLTYAHPTFTGRTTLGDALSTILGYFDGFIFIEAGKIRFGWFPNAPVDASALPEIAEGDLTAKPSGAGFSDWNKGPTSAVVLFKDWLRDYETAPARYNVPANGESRLTSALTRRDKPFIHAEDQATLLAAEAAVPNTNEDSSVNLTVLKSRAVDGAGALLLPGSVINWDYGPHSLDLVCRVTARRLRMGQAADVLTVVRERGAFPRPYAAPVDDRVLPTPDTPGEIDVGDVRLWCLPSGFGPDRQVAPLVNRVKRTIYRANLHFSPSGAAPWEVVLDSRFFAAKCAVAGGGIGAGDATVRVTSASVDFPRFAAQSTVAQVDDTLLLLLGSEVVSVGAITVVSLGTYDLAILRGRRGTVAAAHADAVVSWLFLRAELSAAEHADFYRVRDGGNVYNAGIATKYFKVQLFTIEEDGLAKPDDPGLSLQLPDLTADALTGYTVLLTSEAHTVATDSGGTVVVGELGAGGTARTAVQVFRGSTALTPVAAGPNSDQFAIAIGALVAATATKETDTTVRADTLTANSGSIEITVSVAGAFVVAKKFILTKAVAGAPGADGDDGADGSSTEVEYSATGVGGWHFPFVGTDVFMRQRVGVGAWSDAIRIVGEEGAPGVDGNYTDYIFKRDASAPATPTGDTPAGWSDGPPGGTDPLWMSKGVKTAAGVLIGDWSAPVRLNGEDGADGDDGVDGDQGPGILYRGPYDGAETYYHTPIRRDVVLYSGAYYLTNNTAKNGLTTWGVPSGGDWAAFGAVFESVATKLLLAVDATILKTLIMGDGATADAGVIRSNGATNFSTGNGFWLGNDGTTPKFRVGDPAGDHLKFDGTDLEMTGNLKAAGGSILIGAFTDYSSLPYILFPDPTAYFGSSVALRRLTTDAVVENGPWTSGELILSAADRVSYDITAAGFVRIAPTRIEWGYGDAGTADTNLYRSAANILKTDDALHVVGTLEALGSFKVAGGLIKKQRALSHVETLAGGSAEESFNVDISGYGFTAKPTAGQVNCSSDADYKGRYDFDDGANSATNAVIKISRFDGANTGAGARRFSVTFDE